MKISNIISKDKIILELNGVIKVDIINELVNLFKDDNRVFDIEALRRDIFARENLMSTGVGSGFAIPHCTTNVVKDYIFAFGKSSAGIDFDSIDFQPVHLFFFVAGKDVKQHLIILAKLIRHMNEEVKSRIMKAGTAEEVYSIFQEMEMEDKLF